MCHQAINDVGTEEAWPPYTPRRLRLRRAFGASRPPCGRSFPPHPSALNRAFVAQRGRGQTNGGHTHTRLRGKCDSSAVGRSVPRRCFAIGATSVRISLSSLLDVSCSLVYPPVLPLAVAACPRPCFLSSPPPRPPSSSLVQ